MATSLLTFVSLAYERRCGRIQLVEKVVDGKSAHDYPDIVGSFEFTVLQSYLKECHERPWTVYQLGSKLKELYRLCLVARPHYSARSKRFGSRGPSENVKMFPARFRGCFWPAGRKTRNTQLLKVLEKLNGPPHCTGQYRLKKIRSKGKPSRSGLKSKGRDFSRFLAIFAS